MSHTATIDGEMDLDEVRRRLPEVALIENEELREQTTDALSRMLPEYFWEVPATGSGRYHNVYARRRHGLWVHVKMVFTAYERKVDSWLKLGLIDEHEADMGRAAVLLHDGLKYGHEYSEGDSTVKNHDKLAAHWLRHNTDVPSGVVNAVEAHNGPYYEGKDPENPLERLVHQSDMVASTKNVTCGIYNPAEEIAKKYPDIPRADL